MLSFSKLSHGNYHVGSEFIHFEAVVGLGNPGSEHANDRHNAGFWFVDALARDLNETFNLDKRFFAETAKARVDGRTVHLIKPSNFMNNSGQGVAAVMNFFKIPAEKMLVVHDELDLPPGVVKLKQGGGHGGHNGLRDIVAKIGTKDFWRLRVGIGHPGHKNAVSGYVLKRASSDHQRLIDEALDEALRQSMTIIDGDVKKATQVLHSLKPAEE